MKRLLLVALLLACRAHQTPAPGPAAAPTNNPAAAHRLAWTDQMRWSNVVDIATVHGPTVDARIATAQARLSAQGGGVIYFPPGTYVIQDHIVLEAGVVLRGEPPPAGSDARRDEYRLRSVLEFPRYRPAFHGDGTPIETAFKGIKVKDPATTSGVGVVHLHLERGHIDLADDDKHRAGRARLVVGCVLRNAAVASREIPDRAAGQHAWQRYTDRFRAAIRVQVEADALVANNRLPASDEVGFAMMGYVIPSKGGPVVPPAGVRFDYDNRPGIQVNSYGVGGEGGGGGDGTPETHPHAFRQGLVIRENFVYATGRTAIAFAGDGVRCERNVIRFARDVVRWTTTGKNLTSASSTNDNRAVQMRGWRWHVEGNDYEVFRNRSADVDHYINDGEGLMHEDHANSTVKDSRLLNNRGNTYLSIYKTGGIDGLVVEGNDIRTSGGIAAIFVVADRNSGRFPIRNVAIAGNITGGTGIRVAGDPAENVVVRDNQHVGPGGTIKMDAAGALVADNEGYESTTASPVKNAASAPPD